MHGAFMVDATRRRAVNNESSDPCRMLTATSNLTPFAAAAPAAPPPPSSSLRGGGGGESDGGGDGLVVVELRPPELIADSDAWNDKIYDGLNNGVSVRFLRTIRARTSVKVSDTLQDVKYN